MSTPKLTKLLELRKNGSIELFKELEKHAEMMEEHKELIDNLFNQVFIQMPQITQGERGLIGPPGPEGDSIIGPIGPKGKKGDKGSSVKGKDGEDGKDGENGKTPVRGQDFFTDAEVEDFLVKIADKLTPEQIQTLLMDLPVKGRWFDALHIKGLPTPTEERLKGGGGGGGNTMLSADISSQVDGSTKTFTVPKHQLNNSRMLFCTSFPRFYRLGVDFTTTSTTLTLTSEVKAPRTGQTFLFLYSQG